MEANRLKALRETQYRNTTIGNYKLSLFEYRENNYSDMRRNHIKSINMYDEQGNLLKKHEVILKDKDYWDNSKDCSMIKDISERELDWLIRVIGFHIIEKAKSCIDKNIDLNDLDNLENTVLNYNDDERTLLIKGIFSKKALEKLGELGKDYEPNKIIDCSDEEVKDIIREGHIRMLGYNNYHVKLAEHEANKSKEISKEKEPVKTEEVKVETDEVEVVEELDIDEEKINSIIIGVKEDKSLTYFGELTGENQEIINFSTEDIIKVNADIMSKLTKAEIKYIFIDNISIYLVKALAEKQLEVAGEFKEDFQKKYLEKLIERTLNPKLEKVEEEENLE